jgi:linearmycin/streptolysin S transport system ATP-binding protein
MAAAIEVEALEKRYGARPALRGVSFSVAHGEIVALLGPNGAGKSTTLSILATILAPDAGTVRVSGHALPAEARAARRMIGYVPQRESLYPPLTARENLTFFGRMMELDSATVRLASARVLEIAALDGRADEPVAGFSIGMRRRLNLACGVMHRPRVLLLDEPTVGVDPQSRERIFDAVEGLAREGAAILYSTHYMEEAERLCSRVVLLDEGRIVAAGTAEALVAGLRSLPSIRLMTARPLPAQWLSNVAAARVVRYDAGELEIEVAGLADVPAVVLAAVQAGGKILDMQLHRPNLADVFFALTGRALRDEHTEPEWR